MKSKKQKVKVKSLEKIGDVEAGAIAMMKVSDYEALIAEGAKLELLESLEEEETSKVSAVGVMQRHSEIKEMGFKEVVKDSKGELKVKGYTQEELFLIENYLKNPGLYEEIISEMDKQIVNEHQARKVIFLSACGRLVENCQIASYNVLVNDEAGKGKDYVTSHVLKMIPEEQYIHKTRISPAVFTYWHNSQYEPDWNWNGKVFYPEDISDNVLNSDVFKVMCSNGSSATVVIKQRAIDIDIKGKPVMITTTANSTPTPELTRRFVIFNLDSSADQTKEIMKRHALFAVKGIDTSYNKDFIDCQKLLQRVKVQIPFAETLIKYFPIDSTIMRTNFPRFLDYIKASAAFHQFQREHKEGYVLAQWEDYDIAREVFNTISCNSKMIPLTLTQKSILKVFKDEPNIKLSASQLMPFLKGSVNSLDTCQKNLRILCGYGFLKENIEKDGLNRDILVITADLSIQNESFLLPNAEFIRITEAGRLTEITRITEVSNTINKEQQNE